jgi:hypothetical protein
MQRHLRICAFGVAGLTALATLTSCSLLDPEPQPSPVATKVVDPSMVAPSPDTGTSAPATATPTPGASDAPTDAPSASPRPTASPATTRAAVTPFITAALWDKDANLLDVEAIVPKIVEDDGTCTLVARKGDTVRMVSQPAAPAASTTTCNPLQISGSKLTAGTWTVTISYVSARSTGVAASKTVTVTK